MHVATKTYMYNEETYNKNTWIRMPPNLHIYHLLHETWINTHAWMHACMHVCMYVCMHVSMYARIMCVYMRAYKAHLKKITIPTLHRCSNITQLCKTLLPKYGWWFRNPANQLIWWIIDHPIENDWFYTSFRWLAGILSHQQYTLED